MGQPAKVLRPADVRRVLLHVRGQRDAIRNNTMILLSFKAGLRACEIAGLDWSMVLQPNGRLSPLIAVSNTIAKNGSGRRIPLHPELRASLAKLHVERERPACGAIIQIAARQQYDGAQRRELVRADVR